MTASKPWKHTMTRWGRCLSCSEGTCIVHFGGSATPSSCACTGGQHKKRCKAKQSAAGRPAAPPLSFEERQIVRRFENASDPYCYLCDGVGTMAARLPHVLTWDLVPCPECRSAVER